MNTVAISNTRIISNPGLLNSFNQGDAYRPYESYRHNDYGNYGLQGYSYKTSGYSGMPKATYKRKSIVYGDRIFARITQNGKTVYNFVTERVGSMTDFIAEIRRALKDMKGLVMLHIRNYNQGWGEERPLMLYPHRNNPTSRMLFPWETH